MPWVRPTGCTRSCTGSCTGPSWGGCQPWASLVPYLLCAPKPHQPRRRACLPASCPCMITCGKDCSLPWYGSPCLEVGHCFALLVEQHLPSLLPILVSPFFFLCCFATFLVVQAPASLQCDCKLFPKPLSRAGSRATNHGARLLPAPFLSHAGARLPQPCIGVNCTSPQGKHGSWEDAWCYPLLFGRLGFQCFYVL